MGACIAEVQPSAGALERWGEWVASWYVGQLAFGGVGSVLRLVEKTLMWSTQTSSRTLEASAEAGAGEVPENTFFVTISRPLSWPLFLPLISVLGVARITVYCVSRLFRRPRDTTDMIHWVQSQRRWLRSVKNAGLKNINHSQSDHKLDCTPNGKKMVQSSTSPDHERKRKYEDVEQSDWTDGSDDESTAVKLEKYTKDYDSECDPDFEPNSECESTDVESSEDEDIEENLVVVEEEAPFLDPVLVANLNPSIATVESPESVKVLLTHQSAMEVV